MAPNGFKLFWNGSKWLLIALNTSKYGPNSLPGHGLNPLVLVFVNSLLCCILKLFLCKSSRKINFIVLLLYYSVFLGTLIQLSIQQTRCSGSCSTYLCHYLINYFRQLVSDSSFVKISLKLTPKPHKLGSWNLLKRFTSPHLSGFWFQVSCVRCQLSHVTCQAS